MIPPLGVADVSSADGGLAFILESGKTESSSCSSVGVTVVLSSVLVGEIG